MIIAEAKHFSILFNIRNCNIMDVGNYCCLVCPVICSVGNKPINWKLDTFWMAFGFDALIDQLHCAVSQHLHSCCHRLHSESSCIVPILNWWACSHVTSSKLIKSLHNLLSSSLVVDGWGSLWSVVIVR